MTIANLQEIIASHGELFNFGVYRIRQEIAAGAKVRIPIPGYVNKIMFIYEYRFGDLTANAFNMRFDGARNVVERDLNVGTEQLNHVTKPFPFIIIKEIGASIVVENTGATAEFQMSLYYFTTLKEFLERIEKYIRWKDVI